MCFGRRKEEKKEKKEKKKTEQAVERKRRSENGVVADVLMFGDFCRASKWLKGLSKCCCCCCFTKKLFVLGVCCW
jgi:hypothetical protein